MDNDIFTGAAKEAVKGRWSQSSYWASSIGAACTSYELKSRLASRKVFPVVLMVVGAFATSSVNASSKLKTLPSAPAYNAVGWQFYGNNGSSPQAQTALLVPKTSGLSDGPLGFTSFWIRGYVNYAGCNYGLSCGGVMGTSQTGYCIGERPTGFALPLDNSVVGTTNLRFGAGNNTCVSEYPTDFISGSSVSGGTFNVPFSSTVWQHVLIAWNFTSGASAVEYINGVKNPQFGISNFEGTAAKAPLNINYTNPAGWWFGGVIGVGSGLSVASYADIFVDLTHNIIQPNGTIAPADIAKFYNTGFPVRINASGNCKDPYGWQPTFCFTNDNSNFQTNQGYGGAATLVAWGYNTPFPVPDPVAVQTGVPQPLAAYAQMPFQAWMVNGSLASLGTSIQINANDSTAVEGTNYQQQCIQPGDLLVATLFFQSAGVTTVTPPAGWTQIVAATTSISHAQSNSFYKIADSHGSIDHSQWCGLSGPNASYGSGTYTFTLSAAPVYGNASVVLADYKNVNQANPIDQAGGSVNTNGSSSTVTFPIVTTGQPNTLAIFNMAAAIYRSPPQSCLNYPTTVNVRGNGYGICATHQFGDLFSYSTADVPVPATGTQVSGIGSSIVPHTTFPYVAPSVATVFTIRGANN